MAVMLPFGKFVVDLMISIVTAFIIGTGGIVCWIKKTEDQTKLRSEMDKTREERAHEMEEIRRSLEDHLETQSRKHRAELKKQKLGFEMLIQLREKEQEKEMKEIERSLEEQLETLKEKTKSDLMKQQLAFEKFIELREKEQMRLIREERATEMEDVFRRLLAEQLQTLEERMKSNLMKQQHAFEKFIEFREKEQMRLVREEQAKELEEIRRSLEEKLKTLEEKINSDLMNQKLSFEKSVEKKEKEKREKRLLQDVLQKNPNLKGKLTNRKRKVNVL